MTNERFTSSLITIDELAAITYNSYYFDDFTSNDDLAEYIDEIAPDSTLADALADDIADMLHNANIADLLPFADELNDDAIAHFDSRLRLNAFSDALAELITARIAA